MIKTAIIPTEDMVTYPLNTDWLSQVLSPLGSNLVELKGLECRKFLLESAGWSEYQMAETVLEPFFS